MRLAVLSRASELARIQAMLVGRALQAADPRLEIDYLLRPSAGDRDRSTPLAALVDKGAFTADLSEALAGGQADLVVHSWKDLPLEPRADTVVAATLERADPRDVLLIRRDVLAAAPERLTVLSSSPRRSWLLAQALPALLPWRISDVQMLAVRGNVPTRLRRLVKGRGDALVVAKAALDRLLAFGLPFETVAADVRQALSECRWMILPLRDVPAAPAQGALAVEVARANAPLVARLRAISHEPTWRTVQAERAWLARHGGGCHAALGAVVLDRPFGHVTSVRVRNDDGSSNEIWRLDAARAPVPRAPLHRIWPRPEERERGLAERTPIGASAPSDGKGFWVARADALPDDWEIGPDRIVWVPGRATWRKLAGRAVWVHGCSDGLGDEEVPRLDALAGRTIEWHRLTHVGATAPETLATYTIDWMLPDDLPMRTHFFWTSAGLFREALARWPSIGAGWHASGPGRTARAIRELLPDPSRAGVWLDHDQWFHEVAG